MTDVLPQVAVKTPELWEFTFFALAKRPAEALANA